MSIEVQNVTKTFGTFTALRDVSFQVPTGELVALVGTVRLRKNDPPAYHCWARSRRPGSGAFPW